MCGIAGIVRFSSAGPEEKTLRRMLGFLRHRGPDAFGIYLDHNAGLASARLSIIDLPGGDQPIHNEDKSVWVVYNGEVFNYPELRMELEKRGHQFYTRSDTETLIHLYEDLGPGFIRELNGQFAFAIWDRKKETLLLGRDRLGVRPLFYYQEHGRILFASEMKAIFADPSVPRRLNRRALADIFTCWAPLGSDTPFEDIRQLLPGHYALFSRKGISVERYWQIPFSEDIDGKRPWEEWAEDLSQLLHDATRIRLRSDVPVGAYLSGGLDSTYITSLVKKNFNDRVCTFSVSFADERFDEASFQDQAVESLKTDHRKIWCRDRDIGEVFPQVVWHTEMPLLRTAPAPLFLLSRLVNQNDYKVVLTGEGSDEIFGGYDIFKEDKIRRFWAREPHSKIRPKLLKSLYPDIFNEENSRSRAFLESFFRKGLHDVASPAYSHMIRWENTAQIKTFFTLEILDGDGKEGGLLGRFLATLPSDFMDWNPLSRAQYTEISIFLSNYLLSSQGDRMAMAHAVEGRFPFLDHRVVEFACRVPPRFRLRGLCEKFILRKAAGQVIPAALANRPKRPYRAPISRCFLGDPAEAYVGELLSEASLRRSGYFQPNKVARLVEKCRKQDGFLLSERENMALVGILSTQLLDHLFIQHFPVDPDWTPKNIKHFGAENPSTI
jgi:asparagine synthase (glutamine-hydrolysing)